MKRSRTVSAITRILPLLILASFTLLTWGSTKADAAPPGRQRVEASPVSPQIAQEVLSKRSSARAAFVGPEILSSTEATPEIQEQAWGLKNDVDLIYEYVYSHVEYTPIFGSLKGATGALLDGKANDFDQSSLMVALLRQAGYSANFVYGVIRLYPDQLTNWLGIDNNVSAIGNLLGSAGIPAQIWIYPDSSLAYVDLDHVWVKVNIDGTDYVFDPALKTHSYKEPIDLASAMGYDQATFLSSALSGATVGSDYIQNVNKTNLSNSLAAHATNLISYIKLNHPAAKIDDIIGGKTIDPLSSMLRQTSLPYQLSITAEWTDIPDAYRTSLRVQHLGIDETFYSDTIYGKRLTIFYNGSNQPVLRLAGTVVATGSAATPGTLQNVILSVDHPYAANGGTYADDTRTLQIKAGGSYFLVNGWSEVGSGSVEIHKRALKENIHAGGGSTSEPVLGESLAMIAYTWLAETSGSDELSDQIYKIFTIHHHTLGISGQNESPYIDMPMCLVSVVSGEGDSAKEAASFFSGSGHDSALEWGVIDQLQQNSAVSTVKLIDISNAKSDKIFNATSANYYSTIKQQLVNYNTYELSYVEAYIDAGYRVVLPQDGNLGEGDWTGIGFLSISPSEDQIGHIISGGLSGGFGIVPWDLDNFDTIYDSQSSQHDQSSEPIDLVTGDCLYEHTDLTVGSSAYPFGLEFKRSYNSGARLDDGPLGLGWTHNFDLRATLGSDGFQGLGEDSPVDAAAAIVEHYIAIDLLQGSKTQERVVVSTLAHRWFMDRLIDNVVTVKAPGETSEFLKLPDGTFNPPPGVASVLTQEGDGSYRLQTKHGVVLDFNTAGAIESWQDPNSNTVTFTYSSGKLQSVSNGLGRTLTFTYNGERISQVSDGTGRDFDYAYDATGNLTGVTDAILNTTTYQYDTDGALARVYYPSHPADSFVSNTYDSLGRVETQADGSGNTYQYYFSGFRAEEADPLSNSRIWYFNDQGKTLREIDALAHETTFAYDGQNRLVQKTYPEGNSVGYEYDDKHNLTKETINPKPGSPATSIETLYTYESTFNQIKTVTDPLLNTTTFFYDANGNLTKIQQPEVGGEVPETTFTHNSRGQIETATDPEQMTTAYGYDPTTANLLSKTVDQGGLNLTTAMAYDAVGNRAGLTDPRGNTTGFQYDAMRRLKQVTAPAPFGYVTKYTYDPEGRLTKTERETGDAQNPWQTTLISYTLTGNRETLTDPGLNVTAYQYDQLDRLWKVTDAEDHTTEYVYDARGKLYRVIDAKGNTAEEHAYTPNGKKQSLKDANGNTTLFGTDDFDRLNKITYPDLSYESFTYDDSGNLAQKRTRAAQTISYTYDALNRLEAKTLPGPSSVTYSYDLLGRLEDVADSAGTIHHTYDNAGRLVSVIYPGGKSVVYEYDANGNRSKLTYPDGYFVTYTHDELNRLTDVREAGITILAQYAYDPLSRRTAIAYGNGTSSSYSYGIDDNLATLHHQFNGSSVTLGYTYNKVHNRTGSSADNNQFIYDISADSQDAYVPNSLNQYSSVGGVSFAYDANGNLTSDGVNTYAYDSENRLVAANTPQHAAGYTYDPFGRRTSKTVDGMTTSFLHDGDRVIAEYDGSQTLVRRYVYGVGIDEPIRMTTTTSSYYYSFEALGSVIALSDAGGSVAETYAYSPYGKVDQASSFGNPYLYTGREYDEETGLSYYRARYYDARTGRFLQTDQVGYNGGLNLYAYVGNNPQSWIDPRGLARERRAESEEGQWVYWGWERKWNLFVYGHSSGTYYFRNVKTGEVRKIITRGRRAAGGVGFSGDVVGGIAENVPTPGVEWRGFFEGEIKAGAAEVDASGYWSTQTGSRGLSIGGGAGTGSIEYSPESGMSGSGSKGIGVVGAAGAERLTVYDVTGVKPWFIRILRR
jgi:RHS repeat-associated protein